MKKVAKKILSLVGISISRRPVNNIVPGIKSDYPNVEFIGPLKNFEIGDKVTIGYGSILFACEKITIKDNAMIAVGAIIHTSTHDLAEHPMWRYRVDRPVTIGRHAWLGAGAIILPGVQIGDYSVVGAGSVVTANVPEGCVVAGNPARIIKVRQPSSYSRPPSILEFEDAIVKSPGPLKKQVKKLKE